jgi:hypothetical protein
MECRRFSDTGERAGVSVTTVSAKPLTQYPWLIRLFSSNQRRTYLAYSRSRVTVGTLALGFRERGTALWRGRPTLLAHPTGSALSRHRTRLAAQPLCFLCGHQLGDARHAGVSFARINALADWRTSSLFDPEERLALEYAEAVTLHRVDEHLRARINQHWSDDTIIELAGLIAFQNLSSKFNAALEVPAQGFCRLPD